MWNILAARRGTPATIVGALADALSSALDDATVRARLEQIAGERLRSEA